VALAKAREHRPDPFYLKEFVFVYPPSRSEAKPRIIFHGTPNPFFHPEVYRLRPASCNVLRLSLSQEAADAPAGCNNAHLVHRAKPVLFYHPA
jgi:hypothetical protein